MNPIVELIKSYGTTYTALAIEAGKSKQQVYQMISDNPKVKRPFTIEVISAFEKHGIVLPEFEKVKQKVKQTSLKVKQSVTNNTDITSNLASIFPDSSMVERAAVNR